MALTLMQTYLPNGIQQIVNILSDLSMTICVISQGTVLGPILFLIHINELMISLVQ